MPTCITHPAEPARPYAPAHYDETPNPGWNAGSNSIAIRSEDCYASWKVNASCAGSVTGFCAPDRPSYAYYDIKHGFYVTSANGALVIQVVERGVTKTELVGFAADDLLYIRRVRGRVEYYVGGAGGTKLYTSTAQSTGPIRVGTALYLAHDEII